MDAGAHGDARVSVPFPFESGHPVTVEQFDIEVGGASVARVVARDHRFVLYALHPALRDVDGTTYDTMAEAREAVLTVLDTSSDGSGDA